MGLVEEEGVWYNKLSRREHAPVAQLDRVADFESVGRGFESLRARHRIEKKAPAKRRFYFSVIVQMGN